MRRALPRWNVRGLLFGLLTLSSFSTLPAEAQLPCDPDFGTAWGQPSEFQSPLGLAVAVDQSLWIADYTQLNVRQYSPAGAPLAALALPAGCIPVDLAIGPDGKLFVADLGGKAVHVYSPAGSFLTSIHGPGVTPFLDPWGVAVGPDGMVYVADRGRDRVTQYSDVFAFVRNFGGTGATLTTFDEPFGIAVCPTTGDVYVVVHNGGILHRFDRNGNHLLQYPGVVDGIDVAVDPSGNAYVPSWEPSESAISKVRVLAPDGSQLCRWGKYGPDIGGFLHLFGLAWSSTALYTADNTAGRITRWDDSVVPVRSASWGRVKQIYR